MVDMQGIDVMIFDLDGTLYEDTDHFDHYAELIGEKLPEEVRSAFWDNYRAMKKGEHPVAIGKAYDTEQDAVLSLNPFTLEVEKVKDWDGAEWEMDKVRQFYPLSPSFDFEKLVAIGDGWWLPFAAGVHFGLTSQDTYDCYVKTKAFMVSEEFSLTKTPGLKEQLLAWKQNKVLVLVTNSEKYDVENLLKELNLEGLFHWIIPSAMKPTYTKHHFSTILNKCEVEAEKIVSVGDNVINEIAPALQMGMKAILVGPGRDVSEVEDLELIRS